MYEPPQNYMPQKGAMKQGSCWGSKNIRRHRTNFSRLGSFSRKFWTTWV